jgi:cobalt-zinc-cadmium efflux system outer membrane protein
MNTHRLRLLAASILLVFTGRASAETLTLAEALHLARQRAPLILAATAQIAEARARLAGAKILLQQNPTLEFSAGPRRTSGNTLTDFEVGATQAFELGGKRRSRIAGAQAGVDRETAASQNTTRELLHDVAVAFWQAVAAQERLRLAASADANAGELLRGTQRRFDLGDVPLLDLNVARNAAAKARLQLRSAESEQIAALGDLRLLLGLPPTEPLSVAGDLKERRLYQLDKLLAEAAGRPDLRVLDGELRQAEAEVQLGKSFAVPDVSLGVRYGHDEGDVIARGELAVTLPVFSRGQELRAVGSARATRLRREIDANRQMVANQVTTALTLYEQRIRAADELARNAVQSAEENETLARRSYEEGEISMLDLLLVRRESLETQFLYLNALLQAALQRVEVETHAGVLP